jgi:hypothetical protein
MSFMIRIAWPEATPRVTLAVIMLLEAVVLLGIVSGMTSNMTLKISTYVVASILYILMVSILYRGMFWTQGKQRPQEARSIFYLFTGSWLIFPIVWLLGPNMLDAISYDVVLVMFAFGDVFAKNIFTFVGFKYTQAQIDASYTMDTIDTSDTIATSDTSDTTMKKKSLGNVDPLLIAHIIEHLEEGRTMKSYGKKDEMQKHNQQSHANPWNVPQQQQQQQQQQQHYQQQYQQQFRQQQQQQQKQQPQYYFQPQKSTVESAAPMPPAKDFPLNFETKGQQMIGMTKELRSTKCYFTIQNATVNNMPGGSSVVNVHAINNVDGTPLDFVVIRNDFGETVFCNKFHQIICPQQQQQQQQQQQPSTPMRKGQTPSMSSLLPLLSPSKDTSATDVSLGRHSSASTDGDGPFPLPKGVTLYAWKDGVPKQLMIKSSKVIKLEGDKEANTVLGVDSEGVLDAFVIVTDKTSPSPGSPKSRQVVTCKYEDFTLLPERLVANDLYPELNIAPLKKSSKNKSSSEAASVNSDTTVSDADVESSDDI